MSRSQCSSPGAKGIGVAFQTHPGRQASISSGSKEPRSALESRRVSLLIINDFDIKQFKGFVYEVAATSDIASLYLVSDILITDYSSVFFDYAILNRPMYFYMFDLEAYASELRGFYFDIYKTLPGPIVETEDDLLDQLVHHDYDFKRLEAFNEDFNKWHDGTCAKKVCDLFLKG